METVALVENDVKDNGNAISVAKLDEVFVFFRRAVNLVRSHVEVSVVAPRVVSVKFHDRHELYTVNAHVDDVLKAFSGELKSTRSRAGAVSVVLTGEVTEEKLVND